MNVCTVICKYVKLVQSLVESPEHVIYLPISVNTIRNITLKIRVQDGELINFRNETVTVGRHLKTDNQ
jgi:hypothetical protein